MASHAAPEVGTEVSVEIAGRLRALAWSTSELARRSGVSREVISGVLNGRRLPSLSTYERLRRTLGLLPSPALLTRPAAPVDVSDEHLSRLAACVVTGRSVLLVDLSDATGLAIAAVRESLPKVQERLVPVGLRLVTDGDEVTVMPQAHCAEALERLGQVTLDRELTQEALEALGAVALHTEATREQVEVARGGVDCASLLHRLTERGYLQATFAESGRGRPLRYRLTTKAVSVLGYASLEELQQLFATLRQGVPMLDGANPESVGAEENEQFMQASQPMAPAARAQPVRVSTSARLDGSVWTMRGRP